MKVGFIGLGGMGKFIALRITQADFDLTVCDLREAPVRELVAAGAKAAASPGEAAKGADITIASLPNEAATEAVAFAEDGVLAAAAPGSIFVEASTISPGLIHRIVDRAGPGGIDVIDAPVSGSTQQRLDGTLTIMAGGAEDVIARAMPVFEAYGERIIHVGPSGTGATIKIVNNMTMATNMVSALEAMVLGVKAGLDLDKIREVISVSSGGSRVFDTMMQKIQTESYRPEQGTVARQALHTVRKDVSLAIDLASEMNVPLVASATAAQTWTAAAARGLGEMEIHALLSVLEELSGVKVQPDEFAED